MEYHGKVLELWYLWPMNYRFSAIVYIPELSTFLTNTKDFHSEGKKQYHSYSWIPCIYKYFCIFICISQYLEVWCK